HFPTGQAPPVRSSKAPFDINTSQGEEIMLLSLSVRAKSVILLAVVLIFTLSACGGTSTTSNTTKGSIIVGGKEDTEAQLLTKMYTLLLRKAGFDVTEKAALGNSTIVFQAITSHQIDLYPEFTATALNKLNLPSAYDAHKDYQT